MVSDLEVIDIAGPSSDITVEGNLLLLLEIPK